ncbi:hypothetical protein ACFQH8_09255 [Halomicroarcula sp. GCM10025710]
MSVTDRVRERLERRSPATSGRLSESEFLLVGAAAGALGWGGTQVLAWLGPRSSAALATGLWAVLVAGFATVTVLHGPDEARFSDPMFVWGSANGTAMALTLGGLAGLVPAVVAFWGRGWPRRPSATAGPGASSKGLATPSAGGVTCSRASSRSSSWRSARSPSRPSNPSRSSSSACSTSSRSRWMPGSGHSPTASPAMSTFSPYYRYIGPHDEPSPCNRRTVASA